MSLLDLIDEKRPEILRIAAKHGAKDVRLFGSVARGDDHEGSDVDLLAEIPSYNDRRKPWSFPEQEIEQDLERLLGVHVDVVSRPHPYMRDRILEEAIPLEAPNFRELAVIESQRPHLPLDRDTTYLRLMFDYCVDVIDMAPQIGREAFLSDRRAPYALIHALMMIGEYAAKVSADFRARHPLIPWQRIIGFRNVSIHDYPALDMAKTWDETIQVEAPKLKTQLEKLL